MWIFNTFFHCFDSKLEELTMLLLELLRNVILKPEKKYNQRVLFAFDRYQLR